MICNVGNVFDCTSRKTRNRRSGISIGFSWPSLKRFAQGVIEKQIKNGKPHSLKCAGQSNPSFPGDPRPDFGQEYTAHLRQLPRALLNLRLGTSA
jgi:hypothetical protein